MWDFIVTQVLIFAQHDLFQITEFLLTLAKTDDLFELEHLHSLSLPLALWLIQMLCVE